MELEEFRVYQEAMKIGEEVWNEVLSWGHFEKKTIGEQLIRATDSIAANLSEGMGRYHYNEARHFGYYSRGSLYETKTWLTKAHNRNLLETALYQNLLKEIKDISVRLNNYITSIGKHKGNRMEEDNSDFLNY